MAGKIDMKTKLVTNRNKQKKMIIMEKIKNKKLVKV